MFSTTRPTRLAASQKRIQSYEIRASRCVLSHRDKFTESSFLLYVMRLGCPMAYTPLSIQAPAYIKDLQSNPLYKDQQSWYLCPQSQSLIKSEQEREHEPIVLGPSGSPTESVGTEILQQELVAAMEAPLTDNPQKQLEMPKSPLSSPQSTIKTSSTHPIK